MKFFREKMGLFLGGSTSTVAPEGDLVFEGKAESPLTLLEVKFTFIQPTGASDMRKRLGNPF
jgi:hypothetical protein